MRLLPGPFEAYQHAKFLARRVREVHFPVVTGCIICRASHGDCGILQVWKPIDLLTGQEK